MPGTLRRGVARLASVAACLPAALWIQRHEQLILRRGRPLTTEELGFASDLGIHKPGAVRILNLPRIPSPLGGLLEPLENAVGFSLSQAAGVTLGYGIYVAEQHHSLPLVRHELVHVRQYEDLGGPLPFIQRYFYECMVDGYPNSSLEQEAVRLSSP